MNAPSVADLFDTKRRLGEFLIPGILILSSGFEADPGHH